MPEEHLPEVDVLVATYNSARDLVECLTAVRAHVPVGKLLVIDRHSTDGTPAIAERFGAEVHSEEIGLGYARTLAIGLARTERVLFLDSDVIIRRPDFYARALEQLERPHTGAVVGTSEGHRFLYGLPFGLTLLPRRWAASVEVPPTAQGLETFYFRRALRKAHLRVRYVPDAMEHRSVFRVRTWPEWQGAQIRIAAGFAPRELSNALAVVLLIHMNSGRPRDLLYTPIFYLKIWRGYLDPDRWRTLDRRTVTPSTLPRPRP